jgi:hypothetical protein
MVKFPSLMAAGIGSAALAALAFATPALANGGDFFAELQEHWGGVKPDSGSPYFGFARDSRGKFLQGVTVTATVPPEGNTLGMKVSFQTNVVGHFTIPGFAKHVNPEKVVVSCAKQGYRQANVVRRQYKDRPLAPIEVNCTMAPVTATAAPASRS